MVMDMARCMLYDKEIPQKLWAEAVNAVVYVLNRCPSSVLKGITPEEVWTGRKPRIDHLRIFGSQVLAYVPKKERTKIDPKAREGLFVGYAPNEGGFRIFTPSTNKVKIVREVAFLKDQNSEILSETESKEKPVTVWTTYQTDDETPCERIEEESLDEAIENITIDEEARPEEDQPVQDESVSGIRKSTRIRKYPSKFDEFVAIARECMGEPSNAKEAKERPDWERWRNAMQDELEAHERNATWELTKLPKDRKVIGSKWVFKIKYNADGTLDRYKARLVAQGFSQVEGVDFHETFAPVVRYATIRLILALANHCEWFVWQLDVCTAFLYGDLQEDIYMKPPDELKAEGHVCKLKKSFYGLKQSRVWHERIDDFIIQKGYIRCCSDPGIYVKYKNYVKVYVALYVDDLLITGN